MLSIILIVIILTSSKKFCTNMRNISLIFVLAVVLGYCYAVALGGRGYGGGYDESYYNYGYSGWRGGPRRRLGHLPLGGYKNLKGPGWRGNYGHGGYGGYGPGGYGGYGPGGFGGYGNSGGGSVSSASASASAGSGGLLGGVSNSQAHAETATFNLGPLSATFSKSNANANALGK